MEFIARTVEHPNGRLPKEAVEAQLKRHPQFVPGTVVVAIEKKANKWVAELHEPKVATKTASPPPFATDDADSPVGDSDDAPEKEEPKGESKDDSSDDKSEKKDGGKPSLDDVLDLVKQIAQAVGVSPDGPPAPDEGLDGPDLGGDPEGLDGPPAHGSEGGPPHDETSSVPGSPDTKQIIHRKAPPGAVPVGAPAFASTQAPKVATFDVEEVTDAPVHVAKEEIESLYGPHGYRVRNIAEGQDGEGRRTIRARVSVR